MTQHKPQLPNIGATKVNITQSKRWRLAIFADQLDALGIDFDDQDLEHHYVLRRMHKEAFRPDHAYLDWTESWFTRLREANAARGLYPEPAFSAAASWPSGLAM